MKFGDKLFDLAKTGKAFLHRYKGKTIVIVPFGPYSGVWRYNKLTKKMAWEPRWISQYASTVAYGPGGKCKKFSLPQEVYLIHGTKHPGRLHAESRQSLGLSTVRWNSLYEKCIAPVEQILATSPITSANDVRGYLGMLIACSYALPLALNLLSKDKEVARQKFRFLNDHSGILRNLSPLRRQRFVRRVLTQDIKAAMSATFRKTSQEVINKFLESKDFVWSSRSVEDYMYLQSNNGSVSEETFKAINNYASFIRGHKKVRSLSVAVWEE